MRERGRGTRRRLAGAVLVGAGVLTLSTVGVRYAQGAVARDEARRAWTEASAHRDIALLRASLGHPDAELAPPAGAPVAQLIVPRLALDEVVVEGVEEKQLRAGPGHLPGSAMPGLVGNSVISAHRDRHFNKLKSLRIGDTIITQYAQNTITWRVSRMKVIGRAKPALFDSAKPTLTLTTCWPIGFFGPAPDRLIVTAEPISPAPSPAQTADVGSARAH